MLQWIADNIVALATSAVVLGGAIAAIRLDLSSLKRRVGLGAKRMDEHLAAPTPHGLCSVHTQRLDEIMRVLGEIKERVSTMDDRIVDLVGAVGRIERNGHSVHIESKRKKR